MVVVVAGSVVVVAGGVVVVATVVVAAGKVDGAAVVVVVTEVAPCEPSADWQPARTVTAANAAAAARQPGAKRGDIDFTVPTEVAQPIAPLDSSDRSNSCASHWRGSARTRHAGTVGRMDMPYRRLGRSGLQVSALSFGSWVTFANQLDDDLAFDCMTAAYERGVNFFDNAESYSGGRAETQMGEALRRMGLHRDDFVVSTKLFWGIRPGVNHTNTLNRKYLLSAMDGSLTRFGLDYVDLVFCHRHDPDTPIEETVWAMHDIVARGKALYWGTSEWPAGDIRAAYEIAERHHLHKPVMEQPQYHLLDRQKVEIDYARLYDEIGLGLTTWSPLASGALTGKYLDGIPTDSRAAVAGYEWLAPSVTDEARSATIRALKGVADRLGCTLAQLSIAWCASNPHVSTVITGASRASQVDENLAAIEVLPLLTPDLLAEIDAISR